MSGGCFVRTRERHGDWDMLPFLLCMCVCLCACLFDVLRRQFVDDLLAPRRLGSCYVLCLAFARAQHEFVGVAAAVSWGLACATATCDMLHVVLLVRLRLGHLCLLMCCGGNLATWDMLPLMLCVCFACFVWTRTSHGDLGHVQVFTLWGFALGPFVFLTCGGGSSF